MNRLMQTIMAVGLVMLLISGCKNSLTAPENRTVQFKLELKDSGNSENSFLTPGPLNNFSAALQKVRSAETFDMIRIMVLDMSVLGSWQEWGATDVGKEYLDRRENWEGDRSSWAEWKKFLVDYIPVISDQTLEIRGNDAVGTVNGVKGHTSFVAGVFVGNRVKYWFSGDAHGEEGKTIDVVMYLSYTAF